MITSEQRAKLDALLAKMAKELQDFIEEVASEAFDEGHYSGSAQGEG